MKIETLIGTLSAPSKMPCYGFSISARRCKIGQALHRVENSVCRGCYALRGRYIFPNVQKGLERRYEGIKRPDWPFLMATLISQKEKSGYFRWHDSGDLQDMDHLQKICAVAQLLPDIKFWLPTREYKLIRDYLSLYKAFPPNLTVRVSAHMINQSVKGFENTSEVVTSGGTCPATEPGGTHKCGTCRNCWDRNIKVVKYLKH